MNAAGLVADNLLMALYFFVLIAIPTFNWVLKKYRHPYEDAKSEQSKGEAGDPGRAILGCQRYLPQRYRTYRCNRFCDRCDLRCDCKPDQIRDSRILELFCCADSRPFGNQYLIITTLTMIERVSCPNTSAVCAAPRKSARS